MQYLYGDLTKARHQGDTLGLLQRAIDMAVEVLKLHQQTDNVLLAVQEEKNRLVQAIEDIDKFKDGLQQTIHNSFSDRPPGAVVSDIGQAVTATLQQQTKDGKERTQAQAEEKIKAIQSQIQQCSTATFGALKKFFINGALPVIASSLRCTLDGLDYRAESEVTDVTGTTCSYRLNTGASEFFSAPKRFSDLAPGRFELPVGTKKGFMKKEPVPDLVRADDAMLSQVTDGEKAGEFRLAMRAGSGVESVLVRVNKVPQVGFKIYKVAVAEQPQQVPYELFSSEQVAAMTRFWTGLQPHVRKLYDTRVDITALHIEGKDVLEGRLFVRVIGQLVGYLAPIVREIDSHSLLPTELCLTVDHEEEGKREVFYVRKDKLLQRINELPEFLRKLFIPLGLDRKGPPSVIVEPLSLDQDDEKSGEVTGEVVRGVLVREAPGPKDFPGSGSANK